MKPESRKMKEEIHRFFGDAPHHILFVKCRNRLLVDIEYTDFLNERHVREAVRRIIGENASLSIKRECSDNLTERIKASFGKEPYTMDELFDRMETFED